MTRRFATPPSADDIQAIAANALAGLPAPFADHLGELVLRVVEEADSETLASLGIDHPLDLTGLYEGVPLGEKIASASGSLPDRVTLYRRAILDEWIEDGEDFESLVHHILIHEVGHHFGKSDAQMHALEEQVER